MSLLQANIITGLLFLLFGLLLTLKTSAAIPWLVNFPRSKSCSFWFVSFATLFFLVRHVLYLSEADFGNYKLMIGGLAIGVACLSFIFVSDFLSVRGLSMILLLYSREVLDAAFLQEPATRVILVVIIYFIIAVGLYFGAWPYRMRDMLEWMVKKQKRFKLLGFTFSLIGLLLLALSATY